MRLGAFEVDEFIGEGGMGTVWHGQHHRTGTDVAIKITRPEVMDDPEYRASFDTEVRSVAALNHPNIVTILDFGRIPKSVAEKTGQDVITGASYLVMEYGHGGAIDDYFAEVKWPDLRELLLIVLDALAHAHARDVIHRDMKPENILVGCGPEWDVKLTDFGLAHATDRFRDSGQVESAWGTPQYMAPEQLRGLWREYGPWTDLYGLGCMAFELVCGRWPYDGQTAMEIAHSHIDDPIPKLQPRFEIPEGAEAWIRKMMAKRRENRFEHAADAAYELAQLPSLEDHEDFGVLFEPGEQGGGDEPKPCRGAATVVMPDAGAPKDSGDGPKDTQLQYAVGTAGDHPPIPIDWRREDHPAISDELLGISLGLFGLRAIPLVDRDDERDRLWNLLRRVDHSECAHQIAVEGGAGTGKSQLVEWFCRRAREIGAARVLTAFHSPVAGPADGLIAMLERFLRCTKLPADARRDHLKNLLVGERLDDQMDLQTLLALFEGRSSGRSAGDTGPHRVSRTGRDERYAIIYRLLSLLSERRPVVLWLDDVQWGWDALGFAHYIARRRDTDSARILVAMTARSEALDERHTERTLLGELKRQEGVDSFELPPLTRDDTEQLVRNLLRLDEQLAEQVLERSEGVPLFAVQLVEDWVSRGKLMMGPDGFELRPEAQIELPDDLYHLWDDRLDGVIGTRPRRGAEKLELAAALGQEVDMEEWQAALGRARLLPVDNLVERLVEEDLARPIEGGWRFGHGMLQEALERRATEAGRWARWNAICAGAIRELHELTEPEIPERLARHYLEAGQLEKALDSAQAAVDQAVEHSDYDHALDLIDWRESISPDDNEQTAVQNDVDRARIAASRGEFEQCVQLAEPVATEAENDVKADLAARAALWAGVGRRNLGDLDEASSLLKTVRGRFAGGNHRLVGKAFLELGRVQEQHGDYAAARRHFEEARRRFDQLGDTYGKALCSNALGDVLRRSGELESAKDASLEALDGFRTVDNVTGVADSLNDLAELHRLDGQLDRAREFSSQALRLYWTLDSAKRHLVRLNRAIIELKDGDAEGAAEEFCRLVEVFDDRGQPARAAEAKAGLVAARAVEERWDECDECLRRLARRLEATDVHPPEVLRTMELAREVALDADRQKIAGQIHGLLRTESQSVRSAMLTESTEQ